MAISACDTTPQHRPCSSTTGRRRILCCSMTRQHSSRSASGDRVDVTARLKRSESPPISRRAENCTRDVRRQRKVAPHANSPLTFTGPAVRLWRDIKHSNAEGFNMASGTAVTDRETIRQWVEARGGRPGTEKKTGELLVDFGDGGESLESIDWGEWFDTLESRGLAALIPEAPESRLIRLVVRDSVEVVGAARPARRGRTRAQPRAARSGGRAKPARGKKKVSVRPAARKRAAAKKPAASRGRKASARGRAVAKRATRARTRPRRRR